VSGIFICYRRDDNRHAAGRLYDSLRQCFSNDQIFFDVDNMEPGLDFLTVIQEKVAASDAILVVIGPNWLNSRDSSGQRRLDHAQDIVRLEIEASLQRGIRVIPVLIDGAEMPAADDLPTALKSLASRHAVALSHSSFQRDAEHLNTALSRVVSSKGLRAGQAATKTQERELDANQSAPNEWKAEFSKRGWGSFVIRFWQGDDSHVLELSLMRLALDGNVVETFWTWGSKRANFRVGAHANKFQLRFHDGVLSRVSAIELLIDNQLILSSD
jgi:hypothetical protein